MRMKFAVDLVMLAVPEPASGLLQPVGYIHGRSQQLLEPVSVEQ